MSTPPDDLVLIAVAVLWGAATGALLPRAAYRFSVPSEEADEADEADGSAGADDGWRGTCPGGHPIRGWIGQARCGRCRAEAHANVARAANAGQPTLQEAQVTPETGQVPPYTHRVTSYAPGAVLLPVVTGLLCAALAAATGVRPELAVWLLLAPVGVLLAVVDLRVRRLPDPLTLLLAAAALTLLGPAALLPEHAGSWTRSLLGALLLGAGYLVLHLVNPGGLAFGDVKLALGIGAVLGWYGWATVMLGTFAGFLLGALYGGALVVAGRAGRRTVIAFGPFMLVGAFVGLLIGAYAA